MVRRKFTIGTLFITVIFNIRAPVVGNSHIASGSSPIPA